MTERANSPKKKRKLVWVKHLAFSCGFVQGFSEHSGTFGSIIKLGGWRNNRPCTQHQSVLCIAYCAHTANIHYRYYNHRYFRLFSLKYLCYN